MKETPVRIRFEYDVGAERRSETIWASPVHEGLYRLMNVPFFVYGVSLNDVVFAARAENSDTVDFAGVAQRGGHSTYRIFLKVELESAPFDQHWAPLAALGCTYERATHHLLAIDVPPEADVYRVYDLLDVGERVGVWDFEEGHCGHPVKQRRDPH